MPGEEDRFTDYSEDGVDLTLIRCMLSLTPAERLRVLQSHLNRILAIRELNAESDFFAILRALRSAGVAWAGLQPCCTEHQLTPYLTRACLPFIPKRLAAIPPDTAGRMPSRSRAGTPCPAGKRLERKRELCGTVRLEVRQPLFGLADGGNVARGDSPRVNTLHLTILMAAEMSLSGERL
jgi:hypothetical protein